MQILSSPPPDPRRFSPRRWLRLGAVVVLVALGWLLVQRGGPPVRLALYAARKPEAGGAAGPRRRVLVLPRDRQGRASVRDVLQLAYRGLDRPAYALVVAIDDAGGEHQYVPRPEVDNLLVDPASGERPLGAFDPKNQRPGTFRLYGVFSTAALDARAVRDAAARAAAAGHPDRLDDLGALVVTGTLILEP